MTFAALSVNFFTFVNRRSILFLSLPPPTRPDLQELPASDSEFRHMQ